MLAWVLFQCNAWLNYYRGQVFQFETCYIDAAYQNLWDIKYMFEDTHLTNNNLFFNLRQQR